MIRTSLTLALALGPSLNADEGPLFTRALFPVGNAPSLVVMDDLDGDGRLDLVTSNRNTDDPIGNVDGLSVLLGTGGGGFAPAENYETGKSSWGVDTGDVDGDGVPDIAVANRDSNSVSVLLGAGDGTLGAAQNLSVGFAPLWVVIADADGDGVPDVVTANRDSGDVSILAGQGDGTFSAALSVPFGAGAGRSVAVADVDADGTPDLVVAKDLDNEVAVLLGTGGGAFAAPQAFAVGVSPRALEVGDLDGDGALDIVTANLFSSDVSLLFGAGDGTFAPAVTLAVGDSGTRALALADVDDDGALDLLVTAGEPRLFLGVGDGTFAAPTVVSVRAGFGLALGDVDDDGALDLATAGFGGDEVTLVFGNGDGSFETAGELFGAGNFPTDLAVADLDGDGLDDVAVSNPNGGNMNPGDVQVLLSTGDGALGAAQAFPAGTNPQDVAIADLDGDGARDLVVASWGPGPDGVLVLLGVGDGTFGAAAATPTGFGPLGLAIADLDGDTALDVVTANSGTNDVSVLYGVGDGSFRAPLTISAGAQPVMVAVADLDDDGIPDLVVANEGSDDITVIRGAGAGAFESPVSVGLGVDEPVALAVGDLDADGVPDVVVAGTGSEAVAVLLGVGDTSFEPASVVAVGAQMTALVMDDLDGDGALDLALTTLDQDGTIVSDFRITVLLGEGDGTFDPTPALFESLNTRQLAVIDADGDGRRDLVALSDTDDGTLQLYVNRTGPWTDESGALAGVAGEPQLVGCGPFEAGSDNSLDLSSAAPRATAGLFVALAPVTPVSFKGGTLQPVPFLPPLFFATDALGEIGLPFVLPAGVPSGSELWFQWAIADGAAVKGVSLSNAVSVVAP